MGKIIGIDLGTTNSCVAVMDGNQARVLRTQKATAQRRQSLRIHRMVKSWSVSRQNVRLLPIRRTHCLQSNV